MPLANMTEPNAARNVRVGEAMVGTFESVSERVFQPLSPVQAVPIGEPSFSQ
jgi:hypothetical protein